MGQNKSRSLAIWALVIAIVATSVAYAALQTTLNISGTVTKKGGSWDIHFENVANVTKSGDATMTTPTISGSTTTNFAVTLAKPTDSASFTVDVRNGGSVDAILDSVTLTGVNEAKEKDMTYTATYSDGSVITKNDKLLSGAKKTIKVTVRYDNVASISATDQTVNLGLTLVYVQTDKTTSGEGGQIVTGKPCTVTSGTGTSLGDVITCGTESFNVLSSDTTTITMLTSNYVDTTTNKQSSTAAPVAFDDESNVYAGSLIEGYINSYVNALRVSGLSDSTTGSLITKDQVAITGYCGEYDFDCEESKTYPNFVFSPNMYWAESQANDGSPLNAYCVTVDKNLSGATYTDSSTYKLRPVITILKTDI